MMLISKRMTKEGLFNEALDFTSRVCEDPDWMDNLKALHEASRVAFTMGQYDLSQNYLYRCARIEGGKNAETYSDIGRCIYKIVSIEPHPAMRDYGLKMVENALKIDKKCYNAWLNKGNFKEDLGEPAEAKKCYDKAQALNPNLPGAYTNLGNLKFQSGQSEDACFDYLKALDIDCNDAETLCNLGLALAQTTYKEFASIAFEEAVGSGAGNTDILTNYLYFLLEDHQFDKFLKVSQQAQRVMDNQEFNNLKSLYSDFVKAAREAGHLKSKASAMTPSSDQQEQAEAEDSSGHLARRLSKKAGQIGSLLSNILQKRQGEMNVVKEEDEENDD